ncbi:MAG: heme o synthase [Chitinophagales bacterium]|jgi:protoheme IX farnesyltransferase|nr:heme o synthase [Chitinophagales bacterium]
MNTKVVNNSQLSFFKILSLKLKDIMELTKLRLSLLVVFSAIMAYLLAIETAVVWSNVFFLFLGGFLVTASSNTVNQIIEKDLDKLMTRTQNRPLPAGRMRLVEAYMIAGITGVSGILILAFYFNTLSGLLGALALISYAFIYTPFKRISPVSVFIGAIPGSIPLLIGYTAASGTIGTIGIVLFTIQFFWQIPHFWSIAWLLDEDYKKAGYFLLPSNEGKTRNTALQNIPYLIGLLAVSTLPYILNISGIASLIVSLIAGIYFLSAGIQLATDLTDKSARKLMFASFIYLPIVFLALVIDKI